MQSRQHHPGARSAATIALCVFALASCEVDHEEELHTEAEHDEEVGQVEQELTSATRPINCGFLSGRQCKGWNSFLAHNVSHQVPWNPCLGGAFSWTASANFETNVDRMCVGGVASAGTSGGCTAGTQLTGSGTFTGTGTGTITLSIATNSSVASVGLSQLTATCTDPLFSGVYVPGANANQQVFIQGQTWADFITVWQWLSSSAMGKRLSRIGMYYDNAGTARFDGVFVAGSGGYGLNANMTYSQLVSQKNANALNGMELSDVEAQQTANGVVYIGVWRAGNRQQVLYNGTAAGFWSWQVPYGNQGYRPSVVESYYTSAGVHHYTVVMTRTPGQSGYVAAVGLPYDEFARAWHDNTASGWRLVELETHVANGERLYDGFFHWGTGSQDFVGGSRPIEFSQALSANSAAGMELVDFDRYKLNRTSGDPQREERPLLGSYPAVSPRWMAEIDDHFMNTVGGEAMGYTVALMKGGRVLGASSVGRAKHDGALMTPDAQWDWLSITKMVTAFAALKLAQDQGIDVSTTPILPYISGELLLGGADLGPSTTSPLWDITIEHALTHTSGMMNGGCDNGIGTWETQIDKDSVLGGRQVGTYQYSGYNSCFLRLFVEEVSGQSFEDYVDQTLFRPAGIHNVDCKKDPEYAEVWGYSSPPNYMLGGAPYSEPNTYCAAAGVKGTGFDLLKLMQAIRVPGPIFNQTSLEYIRSRDLTFGLNEESDVRAFVSAGGRPPGLQTYVVQFPATQSTTPGYFQNPASYATGIDAVFFTNSGLANDAAWRQVIQAMAADPNP